jgi:hypothetical protein
MLLYSAKKYEANAKAECSVKGPHTVSLSLSTKSKGALLVSANMTNKIIPYKGRYIKIFNIGNEEK